MGENGGPNGDLWLAIHVTPHPLFDIVPAGIWKLWCRLARGSGAGCKVTVPTLKESILLTILPNQAAGQRLRVKGSVASKQTGDLYAVLKIVMPPKPDENTARAVAATGRRPVVF